MTAKPPLTAAGFAFRLDTRAKTCEPSIKQYLTEGTKDHTEFGFRLDSPYNGETFFQWVMSEEQFLELYYLMYDHFMDGGYYDDDE